MAREIICGIYKITNLINGKVYIGQAKNIYKRWAEHKRARDNNCPLLYKAIRKYGVDNFSFEIQEVCSQDELDQKEIYWIKYYNSCVFFENGWGYNCNEGGAEGKGYIPSLETREKMSKIKLEEGVWCSKPVICDGVEFNSVSDCAREYDIDPGTMSNWLNLVYGMPQFFIDKQLHYKNSEFVYKERIANTRKNVPVTIDGIIFKNMKECAEYLNTSTTNLGYWLDKTMPIDLYNRGLNYANNKYSVTKNISNKNSFSNIRKNIIFNGKEFHSMKELANYLNCAADTISIFIKTGKVPKVLENSDFILNGVKLDTTPSNRKKKSFKTSRWTSVMFDGNKYDNLKLLADELQENYSTVKYWFNTGHLPKRFGEIEFGYLKGGETEFGKECEVCH